MRIERIELFLLRLPLKRAYETSGSVETHQTRVIARIESEGAVGWGESVAPERPWYSGETPETIWWLLDEIAIPQLLATDLADPYATSATLDWIRDHRMAKATLEMGVWDLFAKRANAPLASLLGGTRDRILCGVAIGIQPTVEQLLDRIRAELDDTGYQRVKVKIKPGWDAHVAEAIRNAFPDLPFQLDANSAYTVADIPLFKRIDAYTPLLVEQPLAEDDIIDHATLQRAIMTPVCLDESIHSAEDARKAIELGATRVINIKAGRVGGLAEAKRIHDVAQAREIPVWCGGMLETGIGRAHNVALSTLPNFSLPGDVSASKRYWAEDIVEPEIEVTSEGTIKVSDKPGTGYEVKRDLIGKLTTRSEETR